MKRTYKGDLFLFIVTLCLFLSFICLAEEDTGLQIIFENCITSAEIDIDDLGSTVVFIVEATNNDSTLNPISFTWNSDRGTVETIGNISTYTIEDVQLEDIGGYYCKITDGGMTITGIGSTITLDTHLKWVTECPVDTYLETGDSLSITVEATSDYGAVSYEWYKWEHEGIVATGDTLNILINSSEDYGHYQVQVTDGINYNSSVVLVCPKTDLDINVSDIFVVEGENLVIKGTASILVKEDPEKQIAEEYYEDLKVMWAKYSYYEEENEYGIDDWFFCNCETEEEYGTDYSGVLDGHSNAIASYRLESGVLYADFTLSISDISEIWDGRYVISAFNRYEGSVSQLFSISVKDYVDTKLVGDSGIGISGFVHPDAQLFIEPIEDEETEDFFELAIEDDEYILISKEIYLVITGDAKEYKGELELSFPVGEEFEGKIMKVLHKIGDNLEVIYGTVMDGVLTFRVDNLSPFAITAEKQDKDDENSTENPNEKDNDNNSEEIIPTEEIDFSKENSQNNNDDYKEEDLSSGEKKSYDDTQIPETGDTQRIEMHITIFVVCFLILIILLFTKKNKTIIF